MFRCKVNGWPALRKSNTSSLSSIAVQSILSLLSNRLVGFIVINLFWHYIVEKTSNQDWPVLKTLQYSNYNIWSMFCLLPVFCLLGRHLYSSTTSLRCGLGLVSKVCCTHQSPLTSTVKMEVMWAKTARSYAQATVFYTPGKM